jgi:hypothetical protein
VNMAMVVVVVAVVSGVVLVVCCQLLLLLKTFNHGPFQVELLDTETKLDYYYPISP